MGREQLSADEIVGAATAPVHIPPMPTECTYQVTRMQGPGPDGETVEWVVLIFFTSTGPYHVFFKPEKSELLADMLLSEAKKAKSGLEVVENKIEVAR